MSQPRSNSNPEINKSYSSKNLWSSNPISPEMSFISNNLLSSNYNSSYNSPKPEKSYSSQNMSPTYSNQEVNQSKWSLYFGHNFPKPEISHSMPDMLPIYPKEEVKNQSVWPSYCFPKPEKYTQPPMVKSCKPILKYERPVQPMICETIYNNSYNLPISFNGPDMVYCSPDIVHKVPV